MMTIYSSGPGHFPDPVFSVPSTVLARAFVAFLIFFSPVAEPVQARGVVILTSIWPPYVDPKLPGHGLAVSIVTEAFRRAGYEPRIESLDWERNLENARSGENGVIAAAYRSEERKRDFVFTDAYLTNEINAGDGQQLQLPRGSGRTP